MSGAAKRKKRKILDRNVQKQREAMGRYLQMHKKDDSVMIAVEQEETPREQTEPPQPGPSNYGNEPELLSDSEEMDETEMLLGGDSWC